MLQHMEHVFDLHRVGFGSLQLALSSDGISAQPAISDRGLRQHLESHRIFLVAEHYPQSPFVVRHVHLPSDPKHLLVVNLFYVLGRSGDPAGVAQVLVKDVEEALHMVGNLAAQPPAHLLADRGWQVEVIGLRQSSQARHRGFFVPRFQIECGEDVRVCAESRPLQNGFEAHAAGQDQADLASMLLPVLAQPAQELVRSALAFRRDAVVVPFEQPVDEDGQLIKSER